MLLKDEEEDICPRHLVASFFRTEVFRGITTVHLDAVAVVVRRVTQPWLRPAPID